MGKASRRKLQVLDRMRRRPSCGRVVLGYPVGGSVTIAFHASVSRLLVHELTKPDHRRLLAKATHTKGLYVADNRQMLVEQFLENSAAEWLLQIDTDIEFPATLIETMLEMTGAPGPDQRDILVASVPLGEFASCGFMRTDKPGVWTELTSVPMHPRTVDGIATACALVHRRVFEGIADRHGQCWFHHIYLPKEEGTNPPRTFKFNSQGEDLAFSVRATEAGFKMWAVHIPGLRHWKTKGLSHDDERAVALAGEDSAVGELIQEG